MRRTTVVCCLFLLSVALPADANICAHDNVPAATLLFPFVAVDYDNYPDGETAIINITNMSWDTQVVHVTMWTDFGQPILDFNIILTGYDMVRLDMNEILFHGQLPVTIWSGHSTDEGTQDRGPMSSANSLYGYSPPFMNQPEPTSALGNRCDASNQYYPGLYVTPIPPAFLALFQAYLQTSQNSVRYHSDDCDPPYDNTYIPDPVPWFESRDYRTPTWFYMTADVVEYCTALWPSEPDYFTVHARTDNVLVGDVVWISGASTMAAPAVHIEADVDLGQVATSHGASGLPVSFYHRYAAYNDGVSDYREPLPTAWSMRYEGVGTDFISTSILSWKGSTNAPVPLDLEPIGSNPHSPDELVATNCLAYTYYAWDEDENVVAVVDPQVEINQLPLLTQRIHAEELSLPGTDGWLLFLWPPSNWTAVGVGAPDIWQTWMGSVIDLAGTGKAFLPAVPTANHGCFSDQGSPFFGIDYDYVDSNGYRTSPGARKPVGRNLTVDK